MRKTKAKKRPLLPDPKFNDQLVTRFVNNLMLDGKKSIAFKIFYDALDIVETKKGDTEKTALEIWKDALTNVMPHVEVRSRRVGGANYQVPMPVSPARQDALAVRWIVDFTRASSGTSFGKRLLKELVDAFNGEGSAIRKKVDVEKMAEANKAFAHFRW